MIGVYALGLIHELVTEEEIEKVNGKEYLEEVLRKKNELLAEM